MFNLPHVASLIFGTPTLDRIMSGTRWVDVNATEICQANKIQDGVHSCWIVRITATERAKQPSATSEAGMNSLCGRFGNAVNPNSR
jgi:hypothetical protein